MGVQRVNPKSIVGYIAVYYQGIIGYIIARYQIIVGVIRVDADLISAKGIVDDSAV
jgi:hypothetical protein